MINTRLLDLLASSRESITIQMNLFSLKDNGKSGPSIIFEMFSKGFLVSTVSFEWKYLFW